MFGTATYDFYVDDPRRGLSGGMAPALFCIYIAGDVDPTLHMHQHAMIVITSHHHSIYIHTYIHTCIQIRSDDGFHMDMDCISHDHFHGRNDDRDGPRLSNRLISPSNFSLVRSTAKSSSVRI